MSVATSLREEEELSAAPRDKTAPVVRIALLGSTPSAVFAECTCPEWCERDHENE